MKRFSDKNERVIKSINDSELDIMRNTLLWMTREILLLMKRQFEIYQGNSKEVKYRT